MPQINYISMLFQYLLGARWVLVQAPGAPNHSYYNAFSILFGCLLGSCASTRCSQTYMLQFFFNTFRVLVGYLVESPRKYYFPNRIPVVRAVLWALVYRSGRFVHTFNPSGQRLPEARGRGVAKGRVPYLSAPDTGNAPGSYKLFGQWPRQTDSGAKNYKEFQRSPSNCVEFLRITTNH